VAEGLLRAHLPDKPWRPLVVKLGYSIGFLIVILGRQQLFTETTLTALIPALTRRDLRTSLLTLRVWIIVLLANIGATWVFAGISAIPGVFPEPTMAAMAELSAHTMAGPFWHTAVTGGSAGWLIGLMVWLLPGAGPSRPLIIILLTYVIAACEFPHIVAGSTEAAFGVGAGQASLGDYFGRFFLPTLLGNVIGGTALAGLLNHAQVAGELAEAEDD
jgi:formate-nitrite transporter family protein